MRLYCYLCYCCLCYLCDAVSLRYRNRTEITVLMSVPAEALWFPRRRKSYKVRCRVKIALVSSSRVPFQEGLNGVVAWRLNVSNFDGWRLNFRLFGGWRLTPMTLSFRAEIKPKSCPDGSPLEQLNLSFRRRGSPYCSCDSPPGGSRACKPTRQTHCVIIPRWCLDQLTNHNNRQKQSPTQTTNKRSSIKQYFLEVYLGMNRKALNTNVSDFVNNKCRDLRDGFPVLKLYGHHFSWVTLLCPKQRRS